MCVAHKFCIIYRLCVIFVYELTAWIRTTMLFKMHATKGSQLPDNMCVQSPQAPQGGEGY